MPLFALDDADTFFGLRTVDNVKHHLNAEDSKVKRTLSIYYGLVIVVFNEILEL